MFYFIILFTVFWKQIELPLFLFSTMNPLSYPNRHLGDADIGHLGRHVEAGQQASLGRKRIINFCKTAFICENSKLEQAVILKKQNWKVFFSKKIFKKWFEEKICQWKFCQENYEKIKNEKMLKVWEGDLCLLRACSEIVRGSCWKKSSRKKHRQLKMWATWLPKNKTVLEMLD